MEPIHNQTPSTEWWKEGNFKALPKEVVLHILSYCEPKDWYTCMILSKSWSQIRTDGQAYQRFMIVRCPWMANLNSPTVPWREKLTTLWQAALQALRTGNLYGLLTTKPKPLQSLLINNAYPTTLPVTLFETDEAYDHYLSSATVPIRTTQLRTAQRWALIQPDPLRRLKKIVTPSITATIEREFVDKQTFLNLCVDNKILTLMKQKPLNISSMIVMPERRTRPAYLGVFHNRQPGFTVFELPNGKKVTKSKGTISVDSDQLSILFQGKDNDYLCLIQKNNGEINLYKIGRNPVLSLCSTLGLSAQQLSTRDMRVSTVSDPIRFGNTVFCHIQAMVREVFLKGDNLECVHHTEVWPMRFDVDTKELAIDNPGRTLPNEILQPYVNTQDVPSIIRVYREGPESPLQYTVTSLFPGIAPLTPPTYGSSNTAKRSYAEEPVIERDEKRLKGDQ